MVVKIHAKYLVLMLCAAISLGALAWFGKGSPMAYPPDCPYYVAYIFAEDLGVKEAPSSWGWSYYTFTSRSFRFAYDISHDGSRIAYGRTARIDTGILEESIEVEELSSHTVHALRNFMPQSVRFSPGGDLVAFLGAEIRNMEWGRRDGLFVWNWKTGSLLHVTADVKTLMFGVRPHPISWIGENRLVVESASHEVVSLPIDGVGDKQVLAEGGDPSLSPDGSTLACQRDGKVWLQDVVGGTERVLSVVPPREKAVAWSADSRYIAYVRDIGEAHFWGSSGLFVLDMKDNGEYMVGRVDNEFGYHFCLLNKDALHYFVPKKKGREESGMGEYLHECLVLSGLCLLVSGVPFCLSVFLKLGVAEWFGFGSRWRVAGVCAMELAYAFVALWMVALLLFISREPMLPVALLAVMVVGSAIVSGLVLRTKGDNPGRIPVTLTNIGKLAVFALVYPVLLVQFFLLALLWSVVHAPV